jgi:Zn-dependent M28 family amino/carboxypeptidase
VVPSLTPAPTLTVAPLPPEFDGRRAFADVERQVAFGPRLPGSQAHAQAVAWMQAELESSGWDVELQETTFMDQPVQNVIARRGEDQAPWIILGAHYDSRLEASQDPDPARQADPVPGANDGASGVAVLLELARVLPGNLEKQVWLVFFDAEDQGRIPGWDWILGSRAFVAELEGAPDAVIVVDMIGDAGLNIYKERNSDEGLTEEIWQAAAQRGHGDAFLPEDGYSIIDDHTPFLEKGLRAIDIIDFDYPYWHTVADTPDKVSAESLHAVGDTLLYWLLQP